jgi:uncharacterized protein YeaO (DUF488 family)
MPIRHKQWNDPIDPEDGTRILICRYRPRGLPKAKETWTEWKKELAPSKQLHADFYGKHGLPINWETYRTRYLQEMKEQQERIAELAKRVAAGETITLLCSTACTDASHCHRTLLKGLIEEVLEKGSNKKDEG